MQPVFVLCGPSGCGKTTTISVLGTRSEIQKHFTEGVYAVEVGGTATANELRENLLNILEDLRLRRLLARVQQLLAQPQTCLGGVDAVIGCLATRPLLLLFDDVRANTEAGECVRHALRKLMKVQGPQLRIVVSTEDRAVMDMLPSQARIFIDPSLKDRELMLCRHAGIDPYQVAEKDLQTEMDFSDLCDQCNGLPLYLAICRSGYPQAEDP